MARFFARFDHGPESSLTSNYFNRRVINSQTSSAAATGGNPNYYGGLIDSRSALSTAMKAQLDSANQDGSLGPIIPPTNTAGSSPNITRTGGTLAWNKVYTPIGSRIPGIKIPADFATRPTASVYTDDGNLTATVPDDPGSISDSIYTAATDGVTNVLNSIKAVQGSIPYSVSGTPYDRLGFNASRTLHSIYHNQSLDYFAWDDFTPGAGLTTGQSFTGNSPLTINITVVGAQATYLNDYNPNGYIGFYVSIEGGIVLKNLDLLANGTHAPAGGYITIGNTYSAQTGPTNASGGGNSTWSWNGTNILNWQITLPAGTYTVESYTQFYDVTTKYAGAFGAVTSDVKTVT